MTLQRRLPPLPDPLRAGDGPRDGFDLNAFGRGALAPLASRLRSARAWGHTRAALRLADRFAPMRDAALDDAWRVLSQAARAGHPDTPARLACLPTRVVDVKHGGRGRVRHLRARMPRAAGAGKS